MVSASAPSDNEAAKDLILVLMVQLKPIVKAQISRRIVSSGISDVAFASVYSEKTCLMKLMMMKIFIIIIIIIIIIMNKSQETLFFRRHQKLTSDMKLRPEK